MTRKPILISDDRILFRSKKKAVVGTTLLSVLLGAILGAVAAVCF